MKFDPDNILNQLVGVALTVFIAVIVLLAVLVFRQIWIQHQIATVSDDLQENIIYLEEVTGELQTELKEMQSTIDSNEPIEHLDEITSLLDNVDDQLDNVGDGLTDVTLALEPEPEAEVVSPSVHDQPVYQDTLDEMFTIFAMLISITSILIGVLLGIAIYIQRVAHAE